MRVIIVSLMAFAIVGMAGCTDSGTGSASIYVKDAPVHGFNEIHVVFTKALIHTSGNGTNETSGWITLFENATGQDIDLLAADGPRAAFLGETELEPGRYQQIRLEVIRAYGVADGNETEFTVPSSAIKAVGSFEVQADKETKITIDIDLEKSLKQNGKGEWRLMPVIGKTSAEIVADDESGEDVHEEGQIA